MSSERAEQLLRQILANPDDLALRAVYADELQTAGDPRGEFIALELAGDAAVAGRRIALLAKHARQWWPELPRHCIATHNGFIERVAGSAQALGACARLFATEPVRDVEITGPVPSTFPHAAWPANVRRIATRGNAAAFDVRPAHTVEVLDASGSHLRTLARIGDALPVCRELRVADNPGIGRHLPTLLDWDHVGALEVLDVRRTTLVGRTLSDVLRRDLGALRVLQLSGNPLGDDGARMLVANAPTLSSLEHVELLDCELSPTMIAALRVAFPHARLAFDIADLGTRFRIDALATQLDLVRLDADRWSIDVDGVRRSMWSWDDGREYDYSTQRVLVEVAPLEHIGRALACGAARVLDLEAERLTIPLGLTSSNVYGDTIEATATAVVEYSAAQAPITVRVYSQRVDD